MDFERKGKGLLCNLDSKSSPYLLLSFREGEGGSGVRGEVKNGYFSEEKRAKIGRAHV